MNPTIIINPSKKNTNQNIKSNNLIYSGYLSDRYMRLEFVILIVADSFKTLEQTGQEKIFVKFGNIYLNGCDEDKKQYFDQLTGFEQDEDDINLPFTNVLNDYGIILKNLLIYSFNNMCCNHFIFEKDYFNRLKDLIIKTLEEQI